MIDVRFFFLIFFTVVWELSIGNCHLVKSSEIYLIVFSFSVSRRRTGLDEQCMPVATQIIEDNKTTAQKTLKI